MFGSDSDLNSRPRPFCHRVWVRIGVKNIYISKPELYERMLNIRSNSMNESKLKAKHYL